MGKKNEDINISEIASWINDENDDIINDIIDVWRCIAMYIDEK